MGISRIRSSGRSCRPGKFFALVPAEPSGFCRHRATLSQTFTPRVVGIQTTGCSLGFGKSISRKFIPTATYGGVATSWPGVDGSWPVRLDQPEWPSQSFRWTLGPGCDSLLAPCSWGRLAGGALPACRLAGLSGSGRNFDNSGWQGPRRIRRRIGFRGTRHDHCDPGKCPSAARTLGFDGVPANRNTGPEPSAHAPPSDRISSKRDY